MTTSHAPRRRRWRTASDPASVMSVTVLSAVVACGGVSVGGHTLVAPVARRDAPAAGVADGAGYIGEDGETSRGLAAPGPVLAAQVHAARTVSGCFVADRAPLDRTAPSAAPVDPWRAVDGDQVRVLPHATAPYVQAEGGSGEAGGGACDARRDHCLLDCGWLVTSSTPPYTSTPGVSPTYATDEGFDGFRDDLPYQAFRSLPVTHRTLDVGALAMVLPYPPATPSSSWLLGEVEAIDWDAGHVKLRGLDAPFALAWARVAVLRATSLGAVEVVNGFTREKAQLRPEELILPF